MIPNRVRGHRRGLGRRTCTLPGFFHDTASWHHSGALGVRTGVVGSVSGVSASTHPLHLSSCGCLPYTSTSTLSRSTPGHRGSDGPPWMTVGNILTLQQLSDSTLSGTPAC